jgi:hypothetical protein
MCWNIKVVFEGLTCGPGCEDTNLTPRLKRCEFPTLCKTKSMPVHIPASCPRHLEEICDSARLLYRKTVLEHKTVDPASPGGRKWGLVYKTSCLHEDVLNHVVDLFFDRRKEEFVDLNTETIREFLEHTGTPPGEDYGSYNLATDFFEDINQAMEMFEDDRLIIPRKRREEFPEEVQNLIFK